MLGVRCFRSDILRDRDAFCFTFHVFLYLGGGGGLFPTRMHAGVRGEFCFCVGRINDPTVDAA